MLVEHIDESEEHPSTAGMSFQTSASKLSSSSTSSKQSAMTTSSSYKLMPSLQSFPSFLTSYEQNRLRMVKETYRFLEAYQRDHSLSAYDRLTSMAARVFKTPLAMINFVLADEIRSISHYRVSQLSSRNASNRQNSEGAESPSRIPRQSSIAHRNACTMLKSHTYCHSVVEEHANDILIVYDTLSEKFQSNPDLQPFEDFPVIRFYAAVPIMLGMYRIGTFCIMDPHPRYDFGDREVQMLTEMGGIVSDMLLELTKVSMIASSESVDSAQVIVSLFSHLQSPLQEAQRVTNTIHEYIQDLNTIQEAKFDDKLLAGDAPPTEQGSSSSSANVEDLPAQEVSSNINAVVRFESDDNQEEASEKAHQKAATLRKRRRSSAMTRYQQTSAQLVSSVFALQHEIRGLYQIIEHSIQLSISLLQGQQYDAHEIDFRNEFRKLLYNFVDEIRQMSTNPMSSSSQESGVDLFDDHFSIGCFDAASQQLMAGMEQRELVVEDIEDQLQQSRASSKEAKSLIVMNSSILWITLYSLLRVTPEKVNHRKLSKLQCRLHRKPLHKITSSKASNADVAMRLHNTYAQNGYVSLIFEFSLPRQVGQGMDKFETILSLIKMYGGRFHQWTEGRKCFVDIDLPCRVIDPAMMTGIVPNNSIRSGSLLQCASSDTTNSAYRTLSNDTEYCIGTPTNRGNSSRRVSASTPKFSMTTIRSPMISNNTNPNTIPFDARNKAISPRINTDRRNSNSTAATQNTVFSYPYSMHAAQLRAESLDENEAPSPVPASSPSHENDLDAVLRARDQIRSKPSKKFADISLITWIAHRFVKKQSKKEDSEKRSSKKKKKKPDVRLDVAPGSNKPVASLSWWTKWILSSRPSRVLPLDESAFQHSSANGHRELAASSDDDRTVTGPHASSSPRRQQPYLVPERIASTTQQMCCLSPRISAVAMLESQFIRSEVAQSPEQTLRLQ